MQLTTLGLSTRPIADTLPAEPLQFSMVQFLLLIIFLLPHPPPLQIPGKGPALSSRGRGQVYYVHIVYQTQS